MDRKRRKMALKIWMLDRDISQETIANALGMTRSRVSTYLGSEIVTRTIFDRFVSVGIPPELLPEPRDLQKRGPRRRTGTLPVQEGTV